MNEVAPTLAEAYRLYYKRVLYICYRFTRNHEDAEDLAQDVFLHLATRLNQFRGESKFSTWLTRITMNLAMQRMRGLKKKWHAGLHSLEEMAENVEQVNALARALSCSDKELRAVVDKAVLQDAMERMPAGFRLVLDLREIQGFTHEEIAELLDVTVSSSKSQLHRAKDWLAQHLDAPVVSDELGLDLEQYL